MARYVFFSFHYEKDCWRAGVVRNANITYERRGYIDSAVWEEIKKQGKTAIENWINEQLKGTSVTIVLIGEETASREWVKFEIENSLKKENGLLGIYIHNIKDQYEKTSPKGSNPFNQYTFTDKKGVKHNLSDVVKTYDWVLDDGYNNLVSWIDKAAKKEGLYE